MIDLSKLRAPGWQRVVAELTSGSPDDRAFLTKLTAILGQVSDARQASLFIVGGADQPDTAELNPVFVWPITGPEAPAPELLEASDQRSAARSAAESGQARVFGFDQKDGFYDGSKRGYVVSAPVPFGGESTGPRPVVTLLLEPRSQQALQTTLAVIELTAGYATGHQTRQSLRRTRAAGASLDLAGRLIASINPARGFRGAAFQLVNDLCRQIKADRVALGWVRGVRESGAVRLVALSDTEHLDRRTAMAQKFESAMDECLDQEQPVVYPAPAAQGQGGDVVLAGAITHAHRELAAADARLRVASFPLRAEDRVVGVVTIEAASDAAVDPGTVELLQSALDLVAPMLRLRRSDDRPVPVRAWASALRAGSWLVGPRHTGWKLAGAAGIAVAAALVLVEAPYRVEAPMELRPRDQRKVVMPFEGVLRAIAPGVRPGDRVEAGQLLVELDTTELKLQAASAWGSVRDAETRADAARRAGELGEEQQAQAKAEQARAQFDLYQEYIAQASIRAPIAGTVLGGELDQHLGAKLKTGELLFEIADLDEMIVVARVSDKDIRLVQEASANGPGTGQVATKAYPGQPFSFEVETIVPAAEPEEGENAFEVRGRLSGAAGWMRPGMEGIAKLDTGPRRLIDIGTRRLREQLRLWLWW